jgi:diguanylate cyclase (GGDEF)-like protein
MPEKNSLHNTIHPMLIPALAVHAKMSVLLLQAADINTQSHGEARIDSQTGLLNRRGLDEAFESALGNYLRGGHRRTDDGLHFLMLDIDNFKQYNENQGHIHGDSVISQVANASKAALRTDKGDILGRYGRGDEFIAVLKTNPYNARLVAERIRADVDDLTECTISVGVVNVDDFEHDSGITTLEDFYKLGSQAMRIAKKANPVKNSVHFLDPTEQMTD